MGVTAFGMAVMDIPAGYGDYPEHDHSEDGQEEVYLALGGSGEIEIEGERHPLDQNTMVRVSAGTKRKIWPGDEGIRVLAIGADPRQAVRGAGVHGARNSGPDGSGEQLSRQQSITAASPPNDTCQCGEQVAALLN